MAKAASGAMLLGARVSLSLSGTSKAYSSKSLGLFVYISYRGFLRTAHIQPAYSPLNPAGNDIITSITRFGNTQFGIERKEYFVINCLIS